MKYQLTVRYLIQRRCHHHMRLCVRKHPRIIHRAVYRKCLKMRPLLRFTSSTAGSVDGSKLPKISEHLKPARAKDFVSIVWRLFQERTTSALQAAANITVPAKGKNVSDIIGCSARPGLPITKSPRLVAKPQVGPISVANVTVEHRAVKESENGQKTQDVRVRKIEDAADEGKQFNKSDVNGVQVETGSLRFMVQQLPLYLTSIHLSLPWIGNVKAVPPKKPESEENKSYSVPADLKMKEQVQEAAEQSEPKNVEVKPAIPKQSQFEKSIPKEAVDSRTRFLMRSVATAASLASRSMRLQEFCKHLCENPTAKSLAVKERAIPLMLRLQLITPDPSIQAYINEALAMLGYIRPLRSHGIRILSIDGGGTRGLMAVEILRSLERVTQQPIHRLFDFMCGVSTGSILTLLLGALKAPMDECEELYKNSSTEIFKQSALWGTSNLVLSHAYYDTDTWVKILKRNIGEMPLIETARDPTCPKIATVSTIVSETRLQNFIFRNYEYPHRHQSYFLGSYTPYIWEAIRASAAAPGYFQEYKLGKYIHQDGGVMTNNPAALAIHECRHLWPKENIQCVVSIGTGRYEPHVPLASKYDSSLKTKILRFVDSATDTEMVHTILGDLLPPNRYFRFNPYLTETVTLDETRPEKFKQLKDDVLMYLRKNEGKMQQAGEVLLEPKTQLQSLRDTIKEKIMTYL